MKQHFVRYWRSVNKELWCTREGKQKMILVNAQLTALREFSGHVAGKKFTWNLPGSLGSGDGAENLGGPKRLELTGQNNRKLNCTKRKLQRSSKGCLWGIQLSTDSVQVCEETIWGEGKNYLKKSKVRVLVTHTGTGLLPVPSHSARKQDLGAIV